MCWPKADIVQPDTDSRDISYTRKESQISLNITWFDYSNDNDDHTPMIICGTHNIWIHNCKFEFPAIFWKFTSYLTLFVFQISVIHFDNGHHGSTGPLLLRSISPKPKTTSPNFIPQRRIWQQAGKYSNWRLFREWINWQCQ